MTDHPVSTYTPFVSVIIPIYNGEADIPDLIDCLRSQTYPNYLVEYLLVNNNSQDRTDELLQIAAKDLTAEGINLQVLQQDKIQSSYAARNLGIHHAKGEILLFTDADCRPLPNWIEEFVPFFEDVSVGIVVGELEALMGDSLLEKYAERCDMMSQHFLLEHSFCPYGQTANLAIRQEALQKSGLFRPHLTTGGDADICWRIQQKTAFKLTYAPKAIIRHRHRSTLKGLKSQWKRYGTSNRYLHELYGVDLMRSCTNQEIIYRLSRWVLKDLPKNSLQLLLGKAQGIDLIRQPLDLICFQSRSQGQKEAKLPDEAKTIEWL
ncbi:MAG: glycosyltransferase family 2 protein [Microcystaceae cyanobacterium]